MKADFEEIASVTDNLIAENIKMAEEINVEKELKFIEKEEIKILLYLDDAYPGRLKEITDFPPVLFVKGDTSIFSGHCIAVIGTRSPSGYGESMAKKFSYELAQSGVVIVSGMARGIDSISHQSAIDAGGKTIAVLGSGIDKIYPPENKKLYYKIAERGAVISEFPIGMPPYPGNFLKRNRIISGLSEGVLVIEAPEKSGVFSTVNWALMQGKDVFALPSNITNERGAGTNKLIKEGAYLVTSVKDILNILKIYPEYEKKVKEVKISPEEEKIFSLISFEPVHFDKLLEESGKNMGELSSLLLSLEVKGLIKQLPGKYYVRF